jgi:hypothetical protein
MISSTCFLKFFAYFFLANCQKVKIINVNFISRKKQFVAKAKFYLVNVLVAAQNKSLILSSKI